MLKKVIKSSLVNQVTENIIEYMVSHKMKPGERLPNEMQLMELLGISRSVLREALSRLNYFGIISSEKKNGIIIRNPKPFAAIGNFLPLLVSSSDDFEKFTYFRYVLECGAAELAILFGDKQSIGAITRAAEAYLENAKKGLIREEMIEFDENFHLAIFKAGKNDFLNELSSMVMKHFSSRPSALSKNDFVRIADEHLSIAQAIKGKDLSRCRKLLGMHLRLKNN
jgi:GntR family transcriptional repressor for pyruvate dehydrogenase complex